MRAGSYVTDVTQEPKFQRRLTLRHGCDRDLGDMTTSQYQSEQTASATRMSAATENFFVSPLLKCYFETYLTE